MSQFWIISRVLFREMANKGLIPGVKRQVGKKLEIMKFINMVSGKFHDSLSLKFYLEK